MKVTLILYDCGNDELKEYLISLKGIDDVNIIKDNFLKINIKYNPNLISLKLIKIEIYLFLDIKKRAAMLEFDKHSKNKTLQYKIIMKDICCEYCFMNIIENLFEVEGIEKVTSNFDINNYYEMEIIIYIDYNPNIINIEKIKEINLN